MTVTPPRSRALRLVAALFVVPLLAACGSGPTPSPSVAPTPVITVPPSVPPISPGPSPSGCPTKAPDPMPADQTATVTFNTNFGAIVIKVEGKLGPNAAGNFVALARCGYFNNVIFHRIAKSPPIVQSGDGQYGRLPAVFDNTTIDQLAKAGQGEPGYTIKDDPVTADYTRGTVAMANKGTPNTAGSQFFIVTDDKGKTQLSKSYAIFGHVVSGMEVVDRISKIPTGGVPLQQGGDGESALQPAVIQTATVTQP